MKRVLCFVPIFLMILSLCCCDLGIAKTTEMTEITQVPPTTTQQKLTDPTEKAIDKVLIFCNLPIPELDSLFESGGRVRSEIPDYEYEILLDKLRKRYDIDYNVYSKGEFLGRRAGKVRGEWQLDYFFDIDMGIDYNGEYQDIFVAIDTNHTLVPAKLICDETKTVSKEVIDEIKSKFNLQDLNIEEKLDVDLDGDDAYESIITVSSIEEYFSANILLDHNYKIVSYMQVCMYEDFMRRKNPYDNSYLTHFKGEIADTDGDGIMEIYIINNVYEGFDYNVFIYNKGKFSGDFINMAWTSP